MPSDKYVESLFISSALQTLSKFQNFLLKTFNPLYKDLNTENPGPISPLQIVRINKNVIGETDQDEFFLLKETKPGAATEEEEQMKEEGPKKSDQSQLVNVPSLE
jgi:hypothetical protein